MRTPLVPAALLVGGLLLSGCASSTSASLNSRLVRPGEPALDVGGPPLNAAPAKVLPPAASDAPRTLMAGATIESADARLAAAILMEQAYPSAESHLQVAEEYRRLGIFDDAFERLLLAGQKAPRLAAPREAIARAWRDWGMPERALGPAHHALYLDPEAASGHNTLGTVLDALGQLEPARDAFMRALKIDPSAAYALNNLCYVEYRAGRWMDARLSCEAALRLSPSLAAARNNLGLTHAAGGDVTGARAAFLLAGDAAAALYNLGVVHLARGDDQAAAEAFEAAIKARPTFSAAKARAHHARMRLLTRQ